MGNVGQDTGISEGAGMKKAVEYAKIFHDEYERLAPEYGYETREDTREFDPETPNGRLMIAVVDKIIHAIKEEKQ